MAKFMVTTRSVNSYRQIIEADDEQAAKEVARAYSNSHKIDPKGVTEMDVIPASPDEQTRYAKSLIPDKG